MANPRPIDDDIVDCVVVDGEEDPEPPEFCRRHMPHGTSDSCPGCKIARKNHERWCQRHPDATMSPAVRMGLALAAEFSDRQAEIRRSRADCTLCDEAGWLLDDQGIPAEPAVKCLHGRQDTP